MLNTRSGRRASQQEVELRRLQAVFQEAGVTRYLEIGTRHGDTFYEIVTGLPKGAKAVAVDYPGANWGQGSSRDSMVDCAQALISLGYDITLIFGDSTNPSTIKEIHRHDPFDAVFIDGDHTYEGVRQDWLNYGDAPIVAFHDIDGVGIKKGDLTVEVPRLWNEIKGDYRHEVVIDRADDRRMGIGIIYR